ncbi:aminopeptidase P family protein [Chondromyces apiculatus]|uniref:Xaa-Pro aminopeptidase n=1 Tax=Chondromyces apiculatus DSM 436 TaxID=1192034 RepID=A0A017STV5_9BACT|nr:aminopeptidase P family protein [Chondromyces apiculatus]EYF00399.1 Xaa-Pro aminopeptidase [Chondromyces apiculatus DSM 436]
MTYDPETSASASTPPVAPNTGTLPEGAQATPAPPAEPPQALLDFMVREWAPGPGTPEVIVHAEAFAARRRALSKLFPGEILVIPTGHEQVRANDTNFRFRPGSDFYYLTGNVEPDCVLVLEPQKGGGHRDVLFVEPNPGRSDKTFYTDRVKGELWVGPRLGVEQSRVRFGVHECRELPGLGAYLEGLVSRCPDVPAAPRRLLRGLSPVADQTLDDPAGRGEGDKALAQALSEMRLLKDAAEVKELRTAVAATQRGFEDVIRGLGPWRREEGPVLRRKVRSEREVEGIFYVRARVEGFDVGYGTIAAAGAHACTLHWTRNDGAVKPGELLLLDAGVELETLYTADITRTLPVNGKFSEAQRKVYALVLEAQKAAFAEVRPGRDFLEPNRAAMRVLAEGLEKLGVLPSAKEALREDRQLFRRYTLHNVSHMLGLDVHDCAQARQQTYRFGKLRPGMVLTVEPGLYFQADDLTVPEELRGIGVRIEDDLLVTEDGHVNLSASIPSDPDAVEAWMASLWEEDQAAHRAS